MQLIQLEALTQYMSPKTPIYLKNPGNGQATGAVANLRYAANHHDLVLSVGQRPLTLSQIATRTAQLNPAIQLLRPNGQRILGFQLDEHYHIYLN